MGLKQKYSLPPEKECINNMLLLGFGEDDVDEEGFTPVVSKIIRKRITLLSK
jgi:hypothetical protein